jgi:mannose-6-phosphate isomerase-like protein (cupin superfamily)
MLSKVSLREKFSLFNDYWNPRIIGELNGQLLKVVKFEGPFTWHHHETEDELFLVVRGRFRMDFRETADDPSTEHSTWIEAGEFIIVPHGVEHRPFAEEEVDVVLFEPASTVNTGTIENEFTRKQLSTI